jgi:hypothetical protein
MSRLDAARAAPRCTAMSKRTRQRCKGPAVRGKHVCRFHGARAGAPTGERNGAWTGGRYTRQAIEERRAMAELRRMILATLAQMD